MRRGAQAAYKKYSISKSIVAGDFLFALGFRLIGSASPEVVDYIVDASAAMSAGEFDQKDFEHNTGFTEADYMKIIEGKTAKLIECGAKIGSFLAGADTETIDGIGSFAHGIGMAFQIVDDTLDVAGDERSTGKRIGSDIMEGKPTLPIVYAMDDPEYGDEIKGCFRREDLDWPDVREAIDLITKTDSVSRCLTKAAAVADDARSLLNGIGDSVYKRSLSDLSDYIVSRNR